jgi:nucleoid-associated protein YgaU
MMGILDKILGKEEEKPKEKKPDFSGVSTGGGSTLDERAPTTADPDKTATAAAPGGRSYVVQPGDSLWKIAKRFYGNGNDWPKIHEANRSQIANPDVIEPGQKLVIP